MVRHRVKKRDARTERARKFNGLPDDLDREIGAVHGDEQMVIHTVPVQERLRCAVAWGSHCVALETHWILGAPEALLPP